MNSTQLFSGIAAALFLQSVASAEPPDPIAATGEILVATSGWVVLRAWNDGADPQVLDIYPYATTSPVYVELPGGLPPDPEDAAYFAAWLDRTIAGAEARTDYRTPEEKRTVVDYLRKARDQFRRKASGGSLAIEPVRAPSREP